MNYNSGLWNQYTNDNEGTMQEELSKFIYHISVGLGAKNVCEIGCNIGNNFSRFPSNFDVHGVDMNEQALEKARKNYPSFKFQRGNISKMPYPSSFFDLVFTRGVCIHIQKDEVSAVLKELIRISKKWIFNLEYFGRDGEMIRWKRGDDLLWHRNMKEWWEKFEVDIITDIDIPSTIDSERLRFTLVKKKLE